MDSSGDEFSLMDRTIVCNEVLCNVLRGFLYALEDEDIFSAIDNCFSNDEVYEARKILIKFFFDIFENENPNGHYMGPKEREIKKDENIIDIIEKMHEISQLDQDTEFCIPWNHSFKIISDQEKRFLELVRQKDLEMDKKFQSLEKVIEKKNRKIILIVKNIMGKNGNLVKEREVFSYSSVLEETTDLKGYKTKTVFDFKISTKFPGAGAVHNRGNLVYKRRQFDVQILNSLILFVTAAYGVKLVATILSIFSVHI